MKTVNKFLLLGVVGFVMSPLYAFAQNVWPNGQTIRIIVPFTAGSGTDIIARAVADKLAPSLGNGVSVVIENKPGAGGTIGALQVAKSEPDGFTLLVHSSGHVVNPALYKNLPYDTLNDFAGVIPLAQLPNVMVASPANGYKNLDELIKKYSAHPGDANYASAGNGSATHMNAEKFRVAAKLTANHIPYRGTPEAITDVIAGRTDWFFAPIVSAYPLIKDGKLQALAVGTKTRSPLLPNVPTTIELGIPNSDYTFWVGVLAPAKTPKAIIDRLNTEITKLMKDPEVMERYAKLGAEPMVMKPAQFDQFIRQETEAAAALVRAANITIN